MDRALRPSEAVCEACAKLDVAAEHGVFMAEVTPAEVHRRWRDAYPPCIRYLPAQEEPITVPAPRKPAPAVRWLIVESDGVSEPNPGPSACAAVVADAVTGEIVASTSRCIGVATVNVAELAGMTLGLMLAASAAPGAAVEVRADSKWCVNVAAGQYRTAKPHLAAALARLRQAEEPLGRVAYEWVPRERNQRADALADSALAGRTEGRT